HSAPNQAHHLSSNFLPKSKETASTTHVNPTTSGSSRLSPIPELYSTCVGSLSEAIKPQRTNSAIPKIQKFNSKQRPGRDSDLLCSHSSCPRSNPSKAFSRLDNLRNHLRTVHGEVIQKRRGRKITKNIITQSR